MCSPLTWVIFILFIFIITAKLGSPIIEPSHKKTCLCHMRSTKTDQPAHQQSLISVFLFVA